MDVNRQAWTAAASLLVHPADALRRPARRAAVRPEGRADRARRDRDRPRRRRRPGQPGEPARRAAGVGAGAKASGRKSRTTPEERALRADGRADARPLRARKRGRGLPHPGARRATRRAARTRPSCAFWVAGGRVPPRRDVEQEEVTLVPDRQEYRAGDVAELLVLAPFAPAEGVLTLRRAGLVRERALPHGDGLAHARGPDRGRLHAERARAGGSRRRGAARRTTTAAPSCRRGRRSRAAASTSTVPPARAHARARGDAARAALAPGGETVLELSLTRRRRRAGRERRGRGRGGGRGGARAHRLPAARPARRLLRAARRRGLGLPPAVARAARAPRARLSRPASRRPRRKLATMRGHRRAGAAGGGADGAHGGEASGRGQGGPRSDPGAQRLLGARALRRARAARRRGPRERPRQAARQPDALPGDGGRRGRGAPLRLRRGDARRAAAADGAARPRRAS